jgi:4,5-DOPA dioxygenase extradiol
MSQKMPLIFLGHGSPMNAIEKNIYTDSWREIGKRIGKSSQPRAILMLSAHWITDIESFWKIQYYYFHLIFQVYCYNNFII